MAIQAATASYASIQVGDELPSIQKTETQETIDDYTRLIVNREAPAIGTNLHTDQRFADAGIFAGTVNYGVVTCAFMMELLQKAFPTPNLLRSTLDMRALEPIRSGDTVTFTGKVLEKREEGGQHLVDVEVTGTNQLGQSVAAGRASVPF